MNKQTRRLSVRQSRINRQMIRRSLVRRVDDSMGLQGLQVEVLDGEVAAVNRVQNYGFTSVPHEGSQAVVGAANGRTGSYVALAVDDRRYRLRKLKPGEVAIYDDLGQKVVLYRDHIEVEGPRVVVKSDNVHLGAEGGQRVARIGDRVSVGGGSSAGLWPIVEGSEKVRCS